MGGALSWLFRKKKIYWVPEHRKLKDKTEDLTKWKTVEDWTGWQMQNALNESVANVLKQSEATVELNLSFNGIGDDEMFHIASVIKENNTIKRLILENNHIHDEGAQHLAKALTPERGKTDPVLEVLSLRNNSIGAKGAVELAALFSSNRTLKRLDLYWNNVGNEGLAAFCDNLTRSDYPKDFVLDLRYNGFDRSNTKMEWEKMEAALRKTKLTYQEDDPEENQFRGWPED